MNQTKNKMSTHPTGAIRIIGFLVLMCLSLTTIAQDTLKVRTPQAQQRRNRTTITITDTLQGDSKLPLIYGGFVGCVYALNWNNTMYHDYSRAYIDITDDDPNTKSYENFIPQNYNINQNLTRVQDLFRRKKNYYRRYRDLSMFAMIGVYVLSIIDAYVDAELSSFDISKNLSMKVRPSVIRDKHSVAWSNTIKNQSYGVECSINF